MNTYDHRHCIFCGQSSDVENFNCQSRNNYLKPDTVGNKPHAYLSAKEANQVNEFLETARHQRGATASVSGEMQGE